MAWPRLAEPRPLAHRIGINGVALAMGLQAVVVLAITFLALVVYGAAALLVVTEDPSIDAGSQTAVLAGVIVALFCTGLVVAAFTAPYIVTAWGLRARKPWSHLAGLILSGLSLSNFPFGLIAGVIGFIVLLDKDMVAELKGSAGDADKGNVE